MCWLGVEGLTRKTENKGTRERATKGLRGRGAGRLRGALWTVLVKPESCPGRSANTCGPHRTFPKSGFGGNWAQMLFKDNGW